MNATMPETAQTATGDSDDNLDHVFCCDPDTALCGADISDATDVDDWDGLELPCVVCIDLEKVHTESGHAISCILSEVSR